MTNEEINLNNKVETDKSVSENIVSEADIEKAKQIRIKIFTPMYNDILKHEKLLRENFPDFVEYVTYHTLIASTPPKNKPIKFCDFPGEYSVLKFFENVEKKFNNKIANKE
jgi:hypothetical protein